MCDVRGAAVLLCDYVLIINALVLPHVLYSYDYKSFIKPYGTTFIPSASAEFMKVLFSKGYGGIPAQSLEA